MVMRGLLGRLRGRAVAERPHLRCYTRADCCLCDQARTALGRLAARGLATVEYLPIDGDPVLTAAYGERIPVVCLGETVLAEGKVSEVRLARSLAAHARSGTA